MDDFLPAGVNDRLLWHRQYLSLGNRHCVLHIVIGRKHADAPYKDGTAIWGDFDAQEMFENLAGDLKVKPVKVGFAAYYESIGRVDLTENHKDEKPISISGKQVRETLLKGELVDPRIMRESTSRILAAGMRDKA